MRFAAPTRRRATAPVAMSSHRPASTRTTPPRAQSMRKQDYSCGNENSLSVPRQEQGEKIFQAKAEPGGALAVSGDPVAGMGSGKSLSASARAFFEPRFGRSFGNVRIHDSAAAGERASSVNARAFTYGKDIVFNQGGYEPETQTGRRLLAHELTHVTQQDKAGPSLQRWAISGNNARADSPGDTLGGLATEVGSTGPDWRCIIPKFMRTSTMSPPPSDFNDHYERYVKIGDRFDVSNLLKRTGPTLSMHLFTNPRDVAIAGRFYPGMVAGSGDTDIDISNTATDGTTPIHRMIIFGHASGTTMFGGVETFDPSSLTASTHNFNLAHANLLPRRCWFTRKARVRSVGCSSMSFAGEFAKNYLRRGSAIRSTTSAVSPCCHGVWNRLAFTASSAPGSRILDGPFRRTRDFHSSRFWSRLRGKL